MRAYLEARPVVTMMVSAAAALFAVVVYRLA